MPFGDLLRAQRVEHGLTQLDVAMKLAVDTQTISRWERNRASPDAKQIASLARAIGCMPGDFFPAKRAR